MVFDVARRVKSSRTSSYRERTVGWRYGMTAAAARCVRYLAETWRQRRGVAQASLQQKQLAAGYSDLSAPAATS